MRRVGSAPTIRSLRAVDERWDLTAACGDDPDLHFPTGYVTDADKTQIEEARAVCARCPLTGIDGPCLTRQLEHEAGKGRDYRHGIFAGYTPKQRHDIAKGLLKKKEDAA